MLIVNEKEYYVRGRDAAMKAFEKTIGSAHSHTLYCTHPHLLDIKNSRNKEFKSSPITKGAVEKLSNTGLILLSKCMEVVTDMNALKELFKTTEGTNTCHTAKYQPQVPLTTPLVLFVFLPTDVQRMTTKKQLYSLRCLTSLARVALCH